MDAAELLARFGEHNIAAFFLVLGRISPLFLLAPLFSSKMLPTRARAIIAIGLAIGLAPIATAARGAADLPSDGFLLAGLMLKEIMVGAIFAFIVGTVFAAIGAAGVFLDSMVGFSYGALVDPITGTQSAVLTQLYSLVGVMILIAIGGDGWIVQGLAHTYQVVPLLADPEIGSVTSGVVKAFAGIFGSALQVCVPVLFALVITDAAFGVVSRVVPQLNVFAVGFPAKVAVGLVLIGASLPFVGGWISDELQNSVGSAARVLRVG